MISLLSWGCQAERGAVGQSRVATSETGQNVHFCAGTVTFSDTIRCVLELTPEQQRLRSYSQRLVYRDHRLIFDETVRSGGWLADDEYQTTHEYQEGHLKRWVNRDQSGVIKLIVAFSPDSAQVMWTDEQGRPLPKKGSAASGLRRSFDGRGRLIAFRYVDQLGNPTAVESVGEVRLTLSPNGALVQKEFFDLSGQPTADGSGAHRIFYVVDGRGFELERQFFDKQGQPTSVNGAHLIRYRYDDVGNLIQMTNFGVDGAPARSSEYRAYGMRFGRDAHGNEASRTYLDERDRPMPCDAGYAKLEARFDEHDQQIEGHFYGPDDAPARNTDGYSMFRQTRDAHGNLVLERYFDEMGSPIVCTNRFQRVEISYDPRNNPIAYRHEDASGALMMNLWGYAVRELSYDGDRLVSTRYLDAAGHLVDLVGGYAEVRETYDSSGASTKSYYDAAGKLATMTGTCQGTPSEALAQELRARAADARGCYDSVLRSNPKAHGRLEVLLEIETTGTVRGAKVVRDQPGVPELSSCLVSLVSKPYANKPVGGCALVNLPLNFQAKTGESGPQSPP
jgi:hypothetical protein